MTLQKGALSVHMIGEISGEMLCVKNFRKTHLVFTYYFTNVKRIYEWSMKLNRGLWIN